MEEIKKDSRISESIADVKIDENNSGSIEDRNFNSQDTHSGRIIKPREEEIIKWLKKNYELKKDEIIFRTEIYNSFCKKFKTNQSDELEFKLKLGILIKKIFINDHCKAESASRPLNGKPSYVFLNLKSNEPDS